MVQAGTASKLLAAGLDILLLSMGYVMTLTHGIHSPSIIEGRTILRAGWSGVSGGDLLLEFDKIEKFQEKENVNTVLKNITLLKEFGKKLGEEIKKESN